MIKDVFSQKGILSLMMYRKNLVAYTQGKYPYDEKDAL
jgi:hypothetical protein